ncbi:MAG TPA: DUF222 domain-containing protein [Jiangellaceae bacterium]
MSAAPSSSPPPVAVPQELDVLPPGALLGSLLEDVDIERVRGYDTVVVLGAGYRQLCRQQARVYRALLETGLRRPFSVDTVERLARPGAFAAEEARAALVWSRLRAERAFGFAVDVFVRLPVLGEAMLAGELDEPRARAFVDWTGALSDAQAEQVCAQLLAQAPQLVVGELIDRIKRACLAIDPDYAEKRYRDAVRTRRVRGSRNPDGTANLGGYNQPLDRIAAASEHIDTLARACKRAGDRRPVDHIRSDLFLGLADGTFERMSHDEIVAHVLAHPYTEPDQQHPADNQPDRGDGQPGGGSGGRDGGGSGAAGGHPSGRGGSGDQPNTGGSNPHDGSGDDHPESGDEPGRSDGPSGGVGDGSAPGQAGMSDDAPPPVANATSPVSAARARAVPELRVELTTVLGQNDHPGQIPPWGPIPAAQARALAAAMGSAEWRYLLCGRDGHAITGGLLRARPRTNSTRPRHESRRGGIVEIAAPLADLTDLAHLAEQSEQAAGHPSPGLWAPVLAELAQHAAQAPGQPHTASTDPRRRTPGAPLRRWIQQRDRQCPHPCCRAPARTADQDHRIGFAAGGTTDAANLSPPCRHDHRLKDEAGWAISQPEPRLTVWTSPLGHQYESRPPPVITTLPEPYPDPDNRWDIPTGRYEYHRGPRDDAILPPPPIRRPSSQPTDPEPARIFNPDDVPPF